MLLSKILCHAANTQKGVLDVVIFLRSMWSAGLPKTVAIQRAGLINNHLAIHQQTSSGTNWYSPSFIVGVHLRSDRQNDDHGCAIALNSFAANKHRRILPSPVSTGVRFATHISPRRIISPLFRFGITGLRPSAKSALRCPAVENPQRSREPRGEQTHPRMPLWLQKPAYP